MSVLEGEFAKNITARARTALAGNPRLATTILGAGIITAIVLGFLWTRESDYSVLYAGLSGEQGGRALAELQKLNINYRITEGGRVIMVPAADLGRARLQLAARGVPKTEGDAWGLLDNESLGVSPFVEQVHYVRGLEATLSRTVGGIEGVVTAQVTLAMPKRTGFLTDEPKPSASVLLRLAPGARLGANQVAGIVGLVASSVPGLSRDDVTVVDQDGKALSRNGSAGIQEIPEQLAIVEQVNGRYSRLIEDLLTPIVGRGNFRVTVDTDIDFSQSKQSFVRYGQAHILSQDQTIREGGGDAAAPTGIPGALSNRPPQTPQAPTNTQAQPQQPAQAGTDKDKPAAPAGPKETHAVTNYDIDKAIQYLQDPPWKLHAISVAVLLNNSTGKPIPPEQIKSIKSLVESVIGVGESREVNVVDMPFSKEEPLPVFKEPLWRQPWIHMLLQDVMLAGAGLLVLFGGLFPMLRWLRSRPAPFAAASGRGAVVGRVGGARSAANAPSGAVAGALSAAESSLDLSGVSGESFKVDVEAVRNIVANDPGRTAQVVKEWINSGSRKQNK